MKNIKGVIFDIDGTLLDSMRAWDSVAADFLISRGVTPRPGLNEELRMLGGGQVPAYFKSEYGINGTEDEIMNAINELLEDFYFTRAALKDGALDVLEYFSEHGIKMCVATATDRRLIEPALQRCGVLHFFERVFTCGEENTSKYKPDIYLRAAETLKSAVGETLIFEDALYAIETAKKAGFQVAAVYDSAEDDRQEQIRALSDYYCLSLRDFRPCS